MSAVVGAFFIALMAVVAFAMPASAEQQPIDGWTPLTSGVTVEGSVLKMDASEGGTNIGKGYTGTVESLAEKITFSVSAEPACSMEEDILVVLLLESGNLTGHVDACGHFTNRNLVWRYSNNGPASDPMRWGTVVTQHGSKAVTSIELATVKTGMVARFEGITLGGAINLTPAPTTEPTSEPTTEPTTQPTTEPTSEPTTEPTSEPTTEPTVEPTVGPTPTEPTPMEPTETPVPPVSAGGGGLPLTGSKTLVIGGLGLLSVVVGGILFLLARRGNEDAQAELA